MRRTEIIAMACAGLAASGFALAGGPLSSNSNGEPFAWNTSRHDPVPDRRRTAQCRW